MAQLTPVRRNCLLVATPGTGAQQTNIMADMKFACSHCRQEIECDELWSGHEIQCPTCQGQLMVPPKPDAPPHASLAAAKPGQARLSIGHSQAQRSAAPPPPPPQELIIQQKLNQARAGQKGSAQKWVTIGAVVVIVGVGGYFAYGPISQWWAKRSEAAKASSNTATQEVAGATSPEAAPAAPAAPAPEKELPVMPPVWSLDVSKATIPTSKVNGVISGTNFVAETAMCTAEVLRLFQGASASPDREILVYLHLNPGQSPTGHTWTVSQEMRDRSVPQVVKRWKTNPRYAPQLKAYSSGYAMKLELGEITNGVLPGKIYVALPDTEQSVVAGVFQASTTLADASGAAAANPGIAPSPVAAPTGPAGGRKAAFDSRYGRKR
jgi:DNA-directed RNA polymerase subunit RPC12/RpoP